MAEQQARVGDHATEWLEDQEALRVEERLWWAVGRRAILARYLDRARAMGRLGRLLEIGCGSGGDLGLLARYGQVFAIERSAVLARRARGRGVAAAVYEGDLQALAHEPAFDLIAMFDVLEHIEDDAGFLRQLEPVGAGKHFLLVSVPACPFLFSRHDELMHHYRRYTRRGLSELLSANGYEPIASTYFVFFLFPAVALVRVWEKFLSKIGRPPKQVKLGQAPGWLNTPLVWLLRLEASITRVVPLPIGVWVVVVAQKK